MPIVLLIIILFVVAIAAIIKLYFNSRIIKKELRIKSAECELIKAVGDEYGEKYDERSKNCEIINDDFTFN